MHRSERSMDSALPTPINSSTSGFVQHPSTPTSKYHPDLPPTSASIRDSSACTSSHKKSRAWLNTARSTLKLWTSPNRCGAGDENASPNAQHHRRKSVMTLSDSFRSRTTSDRAQGEFSVLSERPKTASPSKNTCTIGEMRSKKPTDEIIAADSKP